MKALVLENKTGFPYGIFRSGKLLGREMSRLPFTPCASAAVMFVSTSMGKSARSWSANRSRTELPNNNS